MGWLDLFWRRKQPRGIEDWLRDQQRLEVEEEKLLRRIDSVERDRTAWLREGAALASPDRRAALARKVLAADRSLGVLRRSLNEVSQWTARITTLVAEMESGDRRGPQGVEEIPSVLAGLRKLRDEAAERNLEADGALEAAQEPVQVPDHELTAILDLMALGGGPETEPPRPPRKEGRGRDVATREGRS